MYTNSEQYISTYQFPEAQVSVADTGMVTGRRTEPHCHPRIRPWHPPSISPPPELCLVINTDNNVTTS